MKKDIENRDDIEKLVNTFYEKVKADALLGPIFNEAVRVNWEKHLPVMYSFWSNALFFTGEYAGNPMKIHQRLHNMLSLTPEHFQQWNKLFSETVDQLFSGDKALLAKQRAMSISALMQIKILSRPDPLDLMNND